MNKFVVCAILLLFGAGLRAELIAENNSVSNLKRYKISNNQEALKNDYKVLLLEFAKNHFEGSEISIVLSSGECLICEGVLGVLMNASTQSFFVANDIASKNHSVVETAIRAISGIGYYGFILFLVENVGEFLENFSKLRLINAWNPRAQHLIFVVKKPDDKELEMIFNECWSHRVLNVAVIICNQEQAYTYNPYLRNRFEMREKVLDWSKLFYDKLRNMNGHPIVTRYIPFTGSPVQWIPEEKRYKFFGPDFGYGEAFFQSVNAVPNFIDLADDRVPYYRNSAYRNAIWSNRRFQGAELWLNFALNQIVLLDRIEKAYPLRAENLRVLAPKSGFKTPSVFDPYNNITWICVTLSLVTFALYSCVLYKWRGIEDNAILRTFGIFLGKNLANRRHGRLEKSTFLLFTMVSLLIVSAYQGALYGALATVSYYPEINTLSQLYKQTETITTFGVVADYFKTYILESQYSFRVLEFGARDSITYMKTHRDEAFALPHSIAEFTANLKSLSENGVPFYHIMSSYSVPSFVSHNLPYGSPYLRKVDQVFLICREAGLTEYWEEEANLVAILSGVIIPKVTEGRTLKKLSLQTQLITFYMWGIGLLVSSFCFITEICLHKNGKRILTKYRNSNNCPH